MRAFGILPMSDAEKIRELRLLVEQQAKRIAELERLLARANCPVNDERNGD